MVTWWVHARLSDGLPGSILSHHPSRPKALERVESELEKDTVVTIWKTEQEYSEYMKDGPTFIPQVFINQHFSDANQEWS